MSEEIAVAAALGRGATFTVTLPLVVTECASSRVIESVSQGAALLIVDRNWISCSMFPTLLSARTCNVAFASDLDEIVSCISSGTIAQMLNDETTLRASGPVCDQLAKIVTVARGAEIRTVLLWSSGADTKEEALRTVGVDAILTRPIAGSALVAALFDSIHCNSCESFACLARRLGP